MSLPRHFFAPSFRHQQLGRFFALLVGLMVFLASFAMIAETALSLATLTWDQGMSRRLTVEIPAVGDESSMPQTERVRQSLSILRAMKGIISATALPDREAEDLLKPWIDQPELLKALPLPTLIEVARTPDSLLTGEDVRQQIKVAVPDVRVNDHAEWLRDLMRLVQGLAAMGGIMIALAALTLVVVVNLLCRTIMASERDTVSLLHIMGASDRDIAGHFAFHAGRLSAPAAGIGFALAVLAAGGLIYCLRHFADPGVIPITYILGLGLGVGAIPCLAIAIAAWSARLSTLNALMAMP